jgi:hypothetical protein
VQNKTLIEHSMLVQYFFRHYSQDYVSNPAQSLQTKSGKAKAEGKRLQKASDIDEAKKGGVSK